MNNAIHNIAVTAAGLAFFAGSSYVHYKMFDSGLSLMDMAVWPLLVIFNMIG